ncbi:MAG: flagellar hook-associated protein FlgK [Deferribacteres bacterium]|nr:flagellar hook-associated protein FlgK [Deferribacteres bacterium]
MSLFALLNIGKTGINTYQRAMNVTGENVANVHTPGYVRRRAELSELPPYQSGNLLLGTGVDVTEVKRLVDSVLDRRVAVEKGESGFWEALSDVALSVETVLNEHQGLGLNDVMTKFWDAWQSLSVNPEGTAERDIVVESALNLVESFDEAKNDILNTVKDGVSKIKDWVDEANRLIKEIAGLNRKITEVESQGTNANELRDSLSLKLKRLSELVGITYHTDAKKGVQVFLPNGISLVDGGDYRTLSFSEGDFYRKIVGFLNDKPYFREVSFEKDYLKIEAAGEDVTEVLGGKIGGTLKGVVGFSDDTLRRLNDLASEIIYQVNKRHVEGIGRQPITSLTSEVTVSDKNKAISEQENLLFKDRLKAGAFEIKIWDSENNLVNTTMINVSPDDTVDLVVQKINLIDHLDAFVSSSGKIVIQADSGYSFSFDNDTSDFLVAFGFNNFFKGDSIYDMGVSDRIKANHLYVAAGKTPNPGDNTVALEIAQLPFERIMEGNETFGGYYDRVVSELATKVSRVKNVSDDTKAFLAQLEDKWQSVSGVNLDEEMTNLIKFQRAYEASARFITTVDEMINTVVNRMGVVGR